MTKGVRIVFLLMLQFLIMQLYAQDPVFSHYYANGIQLNPSMTGIEGPARIFMGYRNQWPNSGSSYVTYQASYDQYVEKMRGGLGVRVMNDQQGDGVFNSYNLDFLYSYQIKASRSLLFSGGIQAGIGQRSFDPANLVFGDMFDPVSGSFSRMPPEEIEEYHHFYPDFAAGISAFSGNFYGGLALHHLFSPLVTQKSDPTGRILRRYTAHFGALLPVYERRSGTELLVLSPNLIFIQQGGLQQINYGLDMIYEGFLIGLWTRHDMAFSYGNIIFTAGYATNSLRFRYSYDVKLSSPSLRIPNLGAHEFSLVIIYENLNRRNKHRTIKCPKI